MDTRASAEEIAARLVNSLRDALISGMQTNLRQPLAHPDATALVCIAFERAEGALEFQSAYIEVRRLLHGGG